jgi:CRISPR-associated protein Cmr4
LEHLRSTLQQVGKRLEGRSQQQLESLITWEAGKKKFAHHFSSGTGDAVLEEFGITATNDTAVSAEGLTSVLGFDAAIVNNQQFSTFCDDNHLPVIARNSLENGRSTNLWYEQILPRQTSFFTLIMGPKGEHWNDFQKKLAEGLIQIGANASIGYGFCKFTPLSIESIK